MTDLKRKVGLAAILGTWQSTLTDYPYLRSAWRENAEQERLLGVSLTGIYDNPILNNSIGSPLVDLPTELATLQFIAIRENALEADRIGIDASVATTCVKPSGTVSQLVDSASGLHQRHALYYIRRVRVDKGDPLARLMQDAGVPHEEDVFNTKVWVFAFPQQAPEGSVTRQAVTAIEHLELWMLYQRYWCEHKPSVTISVRPEEWEEVGYWVWTHLNDLSGIAFLPYAEHIYQQPPYEECTRQQYESLRARMPRVQWSDLPFYEREDQTMGSQELACSAGGCEAVDIVYTA
jgi:ribonucleoside-diphosphate reductase alpha chain